MCAGVAGREVFRLLVRSISVHPLFCGVSSRQQMATAGVVTTISAMLLHHAPSRFRTHAKIDITPHIKNVNTFTYAQPMGGSFARIIRVDGVLL